MDFYYATFKHGDEGNFPRSGGEAGLVGSEWQDLIGFEGFAKATHAIRDRVVLQD